MPETRNGPRPTWVAPAVPDLELLLTGPANVLDDALPGADLAAAIERLAPSLSSLGGAGWEALLVAIRRQEAHLAALKLQAIERLAAYWADRPTNPDRRVGDEQAFKLAQASTGAALHLPSSTAGSLVDLARLEPPLFTPPPSRGFGAEQDDPPF